MPTPSAALPRELDFAVDRAATPARMNRAMLYIVAWLRRVESVQPDFLFAIEQLKGIGLDRLNEVLTPIFLDAEAIATQLATIQAAWLAGDPLEQLLAQLDTQVTARLADIDASVAHQLAAQNIAVAAQLAAAAATIAAVPTRAERAFITGSF
ncbi:hypothetical protein [Sphingomonas oligophenolica]|uniref:hypothetical protein n=1 Tax=Sphingomonas oligophenolica TaxID=301154 RepID=UPI00112E4BA4|nr:hypothetical protein [Sphingomonas oligophenolica]